MTQKQLGELVNASPTKISDWENGWREPSSDEKKKLALNLKVKETSIFVPDEKIVFRAGVTEDISAAPAQEGSVFEKLKEKDEEGYMLLETIARRLLEERG